MRHAIICATLLVAWWAGRTWADPVVDVKPVSTGTNVSVVLLDGEDGGRADMLFPEVNVEGATIEAEFSMLTPAEFQLRFNEDPTTLNICMPGHIFTQVWDFTFTPDGKLFEPPVTLKLYWNNSDGPVIDSADIYFYNPASMTWESQRSACDLADQTCTFEASHFSTYALGPAVPEPATLAILAVGGLGVVAGRTRRLIGKRS